LEAASAHGDDGGGGLTGIMAVPKDRNQLANMRVIRRNLVYAVGLPPSISNEDTLNRPEYFGQYGKVSKIVLNRSQATNGDPRRASCSAYVTFFHKVRLL
jgi:CCR4-NOT transcription complex subunit 4